MQVRVCLLDTPDVVIVARALEWIPVIAIATNTVTVWVTAAQILLESAKLVSCQLYNMVTVSAWPPPQGYPIFPTLSEIGEPVGEATLYPLYVLT